MHLPKKNKKYVKNIVGGILYWGISINLHTTIIFSQINNDYIAYGDKYNNHYVLSVIYY